jgi:hypothetical protein
MGQRANITSVEAIQAFRVELLVYLSKARPALEEATSEVRRVHNWMVMEKKPYWEKLWLRRKQLLEEVEAALFSAKLSSFSEVSAAQQAAVQKARRAVAEAEDKLRAIRRWDRDYETQTEPLLKQIDKMDNLLAIEVPNAVAYLNETIDTLQKYAALRPAAGEAAGAPTGEASPAGGEEK